MTGGRGPRSAAAGVMIVDDDRGLLRTLQILLEEELGEPVAAAANALEALELAGSAPGLRVALVDVSLPGMSGTGLARRLRERWPRIHILLMSAHAGVLDTPSAREAADRCFVKPIDPDQLLEAVRCALHGA